MATLRTGRLAYQALAGLVGAPVTLAIERLVRSLPQIETVSFVAYKPAPGLDARLERESDPSIEIRTLAETLRRDYGIPFWDAMLAISMQRGKVPDRYVQLAILHDKSPDEYSIDMSREDLAASKIADVEGNLKSGFALAFSSKVILTGSETAHIPLLDFRCQPSARNRQIVKTALNAMGQESGLIVESGRSYHFYGSRLLSHEAWIQFLAMGILFSPIVDSRYVAHRLADGACRLRIGSVSDKPSTPIVAEVFG